MRKNSYFAQIIYIIKWWLKGKPSLAGEKK